MLLENNAATTTIADDTQNLPLNETQAASRLGLKVATLRAWRNQGKGPAYVRLGRAIRYLTSDIDDFLRSNRCSPRANTASE